MKNSLNGYQTESPGPEKESGMDRENGTGPDDDVPF
jgi:hypothetical protein